MPKRLSGPYVSGRLTNKQQGSAISGATITVNKTVYTDDEMQNATTTIVTNGTGDFSFYALPGLYTFTTTAADAAPIEPIEILGNEGLGTDRSQSGASLTSSRPGNRWVALGDSITAGAVDNSNNALGEAWPVYASMASQQRLRLVRDSGVAGNKSSDMIARFATDVAAYAPNIVTILAGTNDYGTGVAEATWQANMKALVAATQAIGAVPVLGTIPPRDAGGYGPTIVAWNAWLRDYAERNGLTVLDFYRTLTDPANGHYLAAYYNDGIHPNAAGHAALAEVAAQVLTAQTPNNAVMLAVDSTDTNNLVGAPGLFLTDAGSGVATGWTAGSAPTGVTKSLVADTAVKGQMQKIAAAAASGLWVQTVTVSSGFSVGDTLRACGVVTSDGGTTFSVQVTFTGASKSAYPAYSLSQAVTRGVFCQDVAVPTGTTAITVGLQVGAASATGTVQFGQVGLFNLTTLGIAA